MKVEVAVLGSPSPIVSTISDLGRKATLNTEQGEQWPVATRPVVLEPPV